MDTENTVLFSSDETLKKGTKVVIRLDAAVREWMPQSIVPQRCHRPRRTCCERGRRFSGPSNLRNTILPAIHLDAMRVFGIDCGTEVTGFGVVDSGEGPRDEALQFRAMGAIRLAKTQTLPERLDRVFRELTAELERWHPDAVAIEEVFYSVNAKSALKLGQVRGVALLAAARQRIPLAEYAPLKIKSSVVGYGLAKKEQVQFMVARLLNLAELPEPSDAADALAIAICHIHTAQTRALQGARR